MHRSTSPAFATAAAVAAAFSLAECGGSSIDPSAADADSDSPTAETITGDVLPEADTVDTPTETDDSGWAPVPGGESCGLYQADVSRVAFPKRTWTSCGTGCEVSPAALAGDMFV